jgi:hypothetical protein
VVACWGWRNGEFLRANGKRVLVMERGYVGDRFVWTSLGWDGLNGRARFPDIYGGGARWRRLFSDMVRPRTPGGEYCLVLGQVPGDASVLGVDMEGWYDSASRRLRALYGKPVYFRPHPVAEQRGVSAGASKFRGMRVKRGSLTAALAGACAVAAYNSNSLTDAALAGVCILAGDGGAMAWPVAGRGLDSFPKLRSRSAWMNRLAWCQWRDEEIESGKAWEAVVTAMDPSVPAFFEARPRAQQIPAPTFQPARGAPERTKHP